MTACEAVAVLPCTKENGNAGGPTVITLEAAEAVVILPLPVRLKVEVWLPAGAVARVNEMDPLALLNWPEPPEIVAVPFVWLPTPVVLLTISPA